MKTNNLNDLSKYLKNIEKNAKEYAQHRFK